MGYLLAIIVACCFYLDDINPDVLFHPEHYQAESMAWRTSSTWFNEDGTQGETTYLFDGGGVFPTIIATEEELATAGELITWQSVFRGK